MVDFYLKGKESNRDGQNPLVVEFLDFYTCDLWANTVSFCDCRAKEEDK